MSNFRTRNSFAPSLADAVNAQVAVANVPVAPVVCTGLNVLTTAQLQQALTSVLMVDSGTAVAAATARLSLGADTAANARALQSLFALGAATGPTNQRLLRFGALSGTGIVALSNTGANSQTYVALTASGTGPNVPVAAGTLSDSANLFVPQWLPGGLTGCCGLQGSERLVSVYSGNSTTGSERIVFNVLANSL
jgi:hypothetical protein